MTIKFRVKSKKDNANIYVVLSNGRGNTYWKKLHFIKCNPKVWDNTRGEFKTATSNAKKGDKNTLTVPERLSLNRELLSLNNFISSQYSLEAINKTVIDSQWLEKKIYHYFNQDKIYNGNNIYLVDYLSNWFEENNGKLINRRTDEPMSEGGYQGIKNAIDAVTEFDSTRTYKTKFRNMDYKWGIEWTNWLVKVKKYSHHSAKGYHSKFIRLLREAEEKDNITIDPFFKHKDFVIPKVKVERADEVDDIYLTIEEIDLLLTDKVTAKLKPSERKTRDIFIVLCWTGIRKGDYRNLRKMYKGGDYIDVMTTGKTNQKVSIPLHAAVKTVIAENGGKLPNDETSQSFNKKIKDVCEIAGLKRPVTVSIKDKTNRTNIVDVKFYDAVTGHTGRRSFATNMWQYVGEETIMAICGWKTVSQMRWYVKDKLRGKVKDAAKFFKSQESKYEGRFSETLKAV